MEDYLLKNLRVLMSLYGYDQRDLYSGIGMSQSVLSTRLNGKCEFSEEEVMDLAELFNVDLNSLITVDLSKVVFDALKGE